MGAITSAPRALPDGSGAYTVTVNTCKVTGEFADCKVVSADVVHAYAFNDGTQATESRTVVFTGPANKPYPGPAFMWSQCGEHADRVTSPGRFGDRFGTAWVLAFFLDAS